MYGVATVCIYRIETYKRNVAHNEKYPDRMRVRAEMSHVCMGWLRLVGSKTLQVLFAEYCLFYRALLQKRHVTWSILLTKATPYLYNVHDLSILYRTYIMHLQMIYFYILHTFSCSICIFIYQMYFHVLHTIWYVTACCIWSVVYSHSPISISLVSFQRNVVKET